jgi:hypothetical protein
VVPKTRTNIIAGNNDTGDNLSLVSLATELIAGVNDPGNEHKGFAQL